MSVKFLKLLSLRGVLTERRSNLNLLRVCFVALATTLLLSVIVYAQDINPITGQPSIPKGVSSVGNFARIAILDQGRVKPLDTYARSVLLQISGKSHFQKESAIHWLARLVFAPYSTQKDEIFLINHPDVLKALGIESASSKRRFSYDDLAGALDKLRDLAMRADAIEPKERDAVETEMIRLYNNVSVYSNLSFSVSFVFPHEDFSIRSVRLRKALGLSPRQGSVYSFLDVAQNAGALDEFIRPLEKLPMEKWDESQKEATGLVSHLFDWTQSYQGLPFVVIPSLSKDDPWQSPWDAMNVLLRDSSGREELQALKIMADSFWRGDDQAFQKAVADFRASTDRRVYAGHPDWMYKSPLEMFFNQLQPFFWAKVCYLLVFFLFLLGLTLRHPLIYRVSWILVGSGLFIHGIGLLSRIVILSRPPVTNLYETFIFVSFVSVICAMLIEKFHRQWLGLVIASIGGTVFLWIAAKFAMEGDTMQMLVAVLNSNFWLSTHVLSISIGYSGMCVAGIVGHMYLLQAYLKPTDKDALKRTYQILLGTLGFGLTMTFLGTNLGGIWADQSWGRFWGWDPKENGALMIVLWGAILFHARLAGIVGPLGMSIGAALGLLVVMWAWFGVNLLSVGLHSYGFTSGLAFNLTLYAVVQIVFLVAIVFAIKTKSAKVVENTR